MPNEKTSKRVAAIAGRILRKATKLERRLMFFSGPVKVYAIVDVIEERLCTLSDLKAVAASCLTQAESKKRKAR